MLEEERRRARRMASGSGADRDGITERDDARIGPNPIRDVDPHWATLDDAVEEIDWLWPLTRGSWLRVLRKHPPRSRP